MSLNFQLGFVFILSLVVLGQAQPVIQGRNGNITEEAFYLTVVVPLQGLPTNPDPVAIYENPFYYNLCAWNGPGNYPNPFNCSQFIMCAAYPDPAYVWECPEFTWYDPVTDECIPSSAQCPWRTMWKENPVPTCENVGIRNYYNSIIIPTDGETCGRNFIRCHNSEQVPDSAGECAEGWAYSKPYNGCILEPICWLLASIFPEIE